MKKKALAAAMAVAIVLTGCANLTDPARITQIDNKQSYWMNYDASRRGAVVISDGQHTKSCAEPAPDIALSLANTLKGNFKAPDGTDVNADATLASTVVALAGRDSAVLLAREALFRLCEASLNTTMKGDQMQNTIKEIFVQVAKIVEEQTKKTTADTDLEKAKLATMQQKYEIEKNRTGK